MLEPLWTPDTPPRVPRPVPVRAAPVAFSVRGRHFLYEPNDMQLFRCDAAARDATLARRGETVTAAPRFDLHLPAARMVVLVLTHRCNLRCRYCFQENGDEPPERDEPAVMPLATARAGLRLLAPAGEATVGFFGGEPLLFPDRLREIVRAARRARQAGGAAGRLRFSLTTNATRLDAAMAAWLAAEGFSLIVSLDGPPRLHDAARPAADGSGSYAATRRGLAAVARHPALARRTTLRATYTGAGVHLAARLAHLNDLAEELGLGNVSVEPADLSEGCGGGGAAPVRADGALRRAYLEAADWWLARLRAGGRPRWHHLAVRLRRLRGRRPAPAECGAGCGYLTVAPDGTLHACHREGAAVIGDAATGIDPRRQAPWCDNRYYARETCPTCTWRNLCGGGCRWVSLQRGDLRRPDPLGCALTEICAHAAAWVLSELSPAERRALGRVL